MTKRASALIAAFASTLLFGLTGSGAFAASPTPDPSTRFSSVVISGAQVFAGTLTTVGGMEPQSGFIRLDTATGKSSNVDLPSELRDREIVALLPTKLGVYVITQYTIEQGDEPLVHHFETRSGKWKRIGEIECPVFGAIHSSKAELTFECEELSDSGKTTPKKRKLALPKGIEAPVRDLKLPQNQDTTSGHEARLLGAPFEWDSLKVKSSGKEETYGISELTSQKKK